MGKRQSIFETQQWFRDFWYLLTFLPFFGMETAFLVHFIDSTSVFRDGMWPSLGSTYVLVLSGTVL